jgi:hypothetical protein
MALEVEKLGLVMTMGGEGDADRAGVTVVSVQQAGVFESTTLRGENPSAVLDWLNEHGFRAPAAIEPVVRDYVARGWVFVASRVRREALAGGLTTVHPLAFTFPAARPVYPMKLTGVDNGDCTIHLYVFGERRAAAPHFRVARCDRVADEAPATGRISTALRPGHPEVSGCISNATVGTKLVATLTPRQMAEDVEIGWRRFGRTGDMVFSHAGAAVVGLNVSLPLAVCGWLLVGASRGGWGVEARDITRWRWQVLAAAAAVGLALFLWLPKVEVVTG